jgi:hypothetical protein
MWILLGINRLFYQVKVGNLTLSYFCTRIGALLKTGNSRQIQKMTTSTGLGDAQELSWLRILGNESQPALASLWRTQLAKCLHMHSYAVKHFSHRGSYTAKQTNILKHVVSSDLVT